MEAGKKGWKKVSSSDTHSVFKNGAHELKIAHAALTPRLKQQLNALPHYDEGGGVSGAPPASGGGWDAFKNDLSEASDETLGPSAPPVQPGEDFASMYNTDSTAPPPQTASVPEGADRALASATDAAPADAAVAGSSDFGMGASIAGQMYGIQEQKQGAQKEAGALGTLGKEQAGAEQGYQDSSNDLMDSYNQKNAELTAERQGLIHDIQNQHVDPQQYLKNMSTGGKILTGIGLVLGGFGAGLSHQPNMAYDFMQNQINRDIDAQKTDLGKKENLLSANFRQTGDLRAATEMTRLQTNDMLSSHLRQLADQTQNPLQQANLLKVSGQLDMQSAQLQQGLAKYRAITGAFNGGSSVPLELLPQDMRERAIQLPGGGMKLAITKDGAKEVRDQLQTIGPIFDQLDQLGSLGAGALVPGSPARAKAEAIQAQLIPAINENAGLKRLSAEDIGNIKNMITDPSHFSTLVSGQAKTQAFKKFLQDKLLSTMGNQLEGGAPQQVQQPMPQYKIVKGVKYMRGPNGQAIPVK